MTKQTKAKPGRKPKADDEKNVVTITARIPRDLYDMLQKQAGKGRKQSEVIRDYLKQAILKEEKGSNFFATDSAEALAWLVGKLASEVEMTTQRFWTDCPHTHQMLLAAINGVLLELAPTTKSTLKGWDKKSLHAQFDSAALKDSPYKPLMEQAIDALANPAILGIALGRGFVSKLQNTEFAPLRPQYDAHNSRTHYSDAYYDLPKIRERLASKRWKK